MWFCKMDKMQMLKWKTNPLQATSFTRACLFSPASRYENFTYKKPNRQEILHECVNENL